MSKKLEWLGDNWLERFVSVGWLLIWVTSLPASIIGLIYSMANSVPALSFFSGLGFLWWGAMAVAFWDEWDKHKKEGSQPEPATTKSNN